jgi:uracil phosphoribosyltransferase
MQVHDFSQENSIYNNFIAELRDEVIQKDRMRFKRNLERCGEISAYEISKEFNSKKAAVKTPLGTAEMNLVADIPVVATILRAGLPLHQGVVNFFDKADNCFISAYRKHGTKEVEVEIEYLSGPDLDGKTVILTDPMIASGKSMLLAYQAMLKNGKPKFIHIVSVIASQEGIDFVKENFPINTKIWVGAIDAAMNDKSYIIPGLGDAGDLAFGSKIDY